MKILQVSPISRIFAEVGRLPLPAFHRLNTFLQMADEKIIFSMNGVGKVLPQNNRVILKDIYLSFFYGAKIGIIGLNGSGKSTLMKIIAGIEKQYQGEVVWADKREKRTFRSALELLKLIDGALEEDENE